VDMIPSSRGPLVMEVNSSPGLEGIESATGFDVAGKVMDYIEKHIEESKTKIRRGPRDRIGV
jgi:ribosomal protein S6--L-glutamate ligase